MEGSEIMQKYLVKGQNIETIEHEVIAADQISFVTIRFAFDNSWRSLHKLVKFDQDEDSYYRVLGTDGTSCLLPAELHPGTVKMSLFGYDTAASQTVRATTIVRTLHIRPSGLDEGSGSPLSPTPDIYLQLLEKIQELSGGRSAYEIAVEHGFIGTEEQWLLSLHGKDGAPGKNGADGKDGRDGIDGKDGRDGTDGKDGRDGIDGKDGKDGRDGKDGTDGNSKDIEDQLTQIRDSIKYEVQELIQKIENETHHHSNKSVLDRITPELLNSIIEMHEHSNKYVLDSITQNMVSSWNDAVKALEGVEHFLSTLVEV